MTAFQKVAYRDGNTQLTALHMRPVGSVRGAVAVYPTFMNTTPGVEAKARTLVAAGYAVVVGDFYGPEAPETIEQAFAAVTRLRSDPKAMRDRFRATIELLCSLEPNLPHLAIGFCLGGMAVLEMARDGQNLAAVASFHGLLATAFPATAPIGTRMLVCHGDADSLVPRSQVSGFWEEMDQISGNWHFHSYAGVQHGFTMPVMPDGAPNPAYDASADLQSWSAMHALFDEVLA